MWLSYLGAALLYSVPPVVTYLFFRQPAFDLAIYDQTLWLLANGGSFNTVAGIHVFGAHFAPILVLVAPLSALPGGAIPELVFEGLLMACAVFPLRQLARQTGFDERQLVFLGVIHAGVFSAAWWGARPWNWAYPLLLWSVVWMLRRPHWTTVAGFGLSALVFREDIGFWVGLVAVSLALAGRIPWRELLVGGIPVAVATFIIVGVLMPEWSPVGTYLYETAIVGGEVDPPGQVIAASVARVLFLFLPIVLIPANVGRLRWIVALPILIPVLGLARRGGPSLIVAYHYELPLVVLLVVVVVTSPNVELRWRPVVAGTLVAAVTLGVLNPLTPQIAASPLGIRHGWTAARREVVRDLETRVTPSTSLSVPDSFVVHYSERQHIFAFPYPFDAPLPEPYAMECPPPQLVVSFATDDETPNWDEARESLYEESKTVGSFTVYELLPGVSTDGECRSAVEEDPNGR